MARNDDLPRHDDPTELEPRPQTPPPPAHGQGGTVAQLKGDIDSGATGDKVPVFDPGAAPVGTGAEAAGTPLSPEMASTARKAERETSTRSQQHPSDRAEDPHALRLIGAIALAVALAAAALWFSFA